MHCVGGATCCLMYIASGVSELLWTEYKWAAMSCMVSGFLSVAEAALDQAGGEYSMIFFTSLVDGGHGLVS